jgi:hypothetical protein
MEPLRRAGNDGLRKVIGPKAHRACVERTLAELAWDHAIGAEREADEGGYTRQWPMAFAYFNALFIVGDYSYDTSRPDKAFKGFQGAAAFAAALEAMTGELATFGDRACGYVPPHVEFRRAQLRLEEIARRAAVEEGGAS